MNTKIIANIIALVVIINILVLTIIGVVLGFSASLVIGFANLLVPPLAFITGLINAVSGVDIATDMANSIL